MKSAIFDNSIMEIDFDRPARGCGGQLNIEVRLPDEVFLNRERQLVKIIDFIADLPVMLQAAELQCGRIFPRIVYSPVGTKYICSLTVCFSATSGKSVPGEKLNTICDNLIKHWHASLGNCHDTGEGK